MLRRVFTLASAVFLLLCIGTAVLRVRSHSVYDSWCYFRPTGGYRELSSGYGRVCTAWGTSPIPLAGTTHSVVKIEAGMAAPWGKTNMLGFRLALGRKRITYGIAEVDGQTLSRTPLGIERSSLLVVPYWFLCLLLAALAGIAFRLRRRPAAPGHCPTCGYDLRASTGRCPECGVAIPQQVSA